MLGATVRGRSAGRTRLQALGAVPSEPVAATAMQASELLGEASLRRGGGSPATSSWSKGTWEGDGYAPATASSSRAASRERGDVLSRLHALERHGRDAQSVGPPLSARQKLPQEVEQLVGDLDQRVTQIEQAESSRFRMMMDQVQKLTENLQSLRVQRELQEERRQQELRYLENNVEQDHDKGKDDRRDFHLRLEERTDKFFQDRIQEIRKARVSAKAVGEEQRDACTQLSDRLNHEVYRIAGVLEEQRAAREEYGDRIQTSLQAEFQKVEEAVHAERNLRHEAQHTMQRMVQDVCLRVRSEIQQERDTRESVQNRLLGLLEETCGRIETSFGGVVSSHGLGSPMGAMHSARSALY